MRIYRTDCDGVEVLRFSGSVGLGEARALVDRLGSSRTAADGCCVLDFSRVGHVDYRAFAVLEDLRRSNSGIILSGLNDYVLNIFALTSDPTTVPVFPTWRAALQYLAAERGKTREHAVAGEAGRA